jgi:hypothetical protein
MTGIQHGKSRGCKSDSYTAFCEVYQTPLPLQRSCWCCIRIFCSRGERAVLDQVLGAVVDLDL